MSRVLTDEQLKHWSQELVKEFKRKLDGYKKRSPAEQALRDAALGYEEFGEFEKRRYEQQTTILQQLYNNYVLERK